MNSQNFTIIYRENEKIHKMEPKSKKFILLQAAISVRKKTANSICFQNRKGNNRQSSLLEQKQKKWFICECVFCCTTVLQHK